MRKFLQTCIVLLITVTFFASCSNSIKEAKFIPKDATFVLAAQPASLNEKLDKANIKLDTLYKELASKDSSFNLKFEELKDCGIDWLGNIYIYMHTKTGVNNSSVLYVNFLANIKDSSKVVAFVKKQDKQHTLVFKTAKEFSYIKMGNDCILSWNDKYLLVTASHKNGYTVYPPLSGLDSVKKVQFTPTDDVTDADLLQQVTTYYTQKESESIASVKQFSNMFKEKADAYMFGSSNGYLSSLNSLPYLQVPKVQELLADNYSTSTINFADGQIEMKGDSYLNATVSALLKKYAGPTINTSLIENYPSQHVNGFMLFAFNPQIFTGLLKEMGVEPIADSYLDKMGFTTSDVFKCFKGDIAVTVSDANFAKDSLVNGKKQPAAQFLFDATIGDKPSLDKIMSKVVESGFVVKEGNVYKGGEFIKTLGMFVQIDDKHFVVATDSLLYAKYLAQSGKSNISSDVVSKIKGKSTGMYVNIESLLAAANSKDFKNPFKDAIITGDNFDGSKLHSEAIIRLKDEKQNSLATLLKMIPEFADVARKKNVTAEDVKSLSFLKFL
ncbi:MAG: hypothetical protein C0459_05850 [Chitinophaga sp.]|jgi:Domain of unknown function (DUF4836)|nr:hypothetical protein [Chitinophaga sp.]